MDHAWGAQDISAPKRTALPDVPVEREMVLEDVQSGFVGAVVRVEKSGGLHVMVLEDRRGKHRTFRLGHGFLLDGRPVHVVAPAPRSASTPARTASGSVRVEGARARTARASRIWVEGQHDAELVEKVWGDDLRLEGIVVEPLHGIDDLEGAIRDFGPGPQRRLGILVDHLLPGTKEARIAQQAMTVPGARHAWPVVPRHQDWKTGILAGLGWPHHDKASVARGWKRILSGVSTYADLEPSLLGRVEEVIDFLTAHPGPG
jgi:hypothetical protein